MSILVTGAGGFIGSALLRALEARGRAADGATRSAAGGRNRLPAPALDAQADWRPLLRGRQAVIHTAARVHMMGEHGADADRAHHAINTEGSLALAAQAAEAGVGRFVFISTIKVMGEASLHPFRADDEPAPRDAYARAKLEAERGIARIGENTGMEFVVIRPPLVYGPGAKGNFATMVRWLERGLPLPFGALTGNRRSLVALDNLVDLILTCVDHPAAARQTFLAADGEDLSTADLLRRLATALDVPARLWPVPAWALKAAAGLAGRAAEMSRLTGNLQIDLGHTRQTLGWTPPVGVDEGLRRAAGRRR